MKLYEPSGTVTLVQSSLPGNSEGLAPSEVNVNVKSEGLTSNGEKTCLHTLRVPVVGVGVGVTPEFGRSRFGR